MQQDDTIPTTGHDCPRCGGSLTYVREVEDEETEGEAYSTGSTFTIPLASSVFKCEADGSLWRIYISGAIKPFTGKT